MPVATSNPTQAQAELTTLRTVLSSGVAAVKQVTSELQALKTAQDARARKRANLEAKLASLQKQAKDAVAKGQGVMAVADAYKVGALLAGLDGARSVSEDGIAPRRDDERPILSRRRARRSSLGDLASGASTWEANQAAKINEWANQGYHPTMLEAAMRLALAPNTEPEAALAGDGSFATLAGVVRDSIIVTGVQVRALAALAAFRASVLGQASDYPWNQDARDEYDAAVQGDLRYIVSHQPSSGFVEKAIRQTAGVTATLDKYVPGWSVLLDVATPVLPIAPLISAIAGAVPIVGGAAQIALSATPFMSPGALMPLSPVTPLSYEGATPVVQAAGASSVFGVVPGVAPQVQLFDAPLTTIAGPAGAIRFQITKSTAQSAAQGAGVLDTLEQLGADLIDGYALAATLAGFFLTPVEAPILFALQSAIQAMQAAISLKRALEASAALKAAADRARAAAAARAAADAAAASGLQAQIDALARRLGQAAAPLVGAAASTGVGTLLVWGGLLWLASEVFA